MINMDALSFFGNMASILSFTVQGMALIGNATKTTLFYGDKDEKIKEDVVIIVEVSRPCIASVKKFLDKSNIDASIFVVKEKNEKDRLDNNSRTQWENIVKDFSKVVKTIHKNATPERLHIFVSAPASLALGMGCSIRTLYGAYIYNYNTETQSYDLVLIADDRLL